MDAYGKAIQQRPNGNDSNKFEITTRLSTIIMGKPIQDKRRTM